MGLFILQTVGIFEEMVIETMGCSSSVMRKCYLLQSNGFP